jgi:hypothetical protein
LSWPAVLPAAARRALLGALLVGGAFLLGLLLGQPAEAADGAGDVPSPVDRVVGGSGYRSGGGGAATDAGSGGTGRSVGGLVDAVGEGLGSVRADVPSSTPFPPVARRPDTPSAVPSVPDAPIVSDLPGVPDVPSAPDPSSVPGASGTSGTSGSTSQPNSPGQLDPSAQPIPSAVAELPILGARPGLVDPSSPSTPSTPSDFPALSDLPILSDLPVLSDLLPVLCDVLPALSDLVGGAVLPAWPAFPADPVVPAEPVLPAFPVLPVNLLPAPVGSGPVGSVGAEPVPAHALMPSDPVTPSTAGDQDAGQRGRDQGLAEAEVVEVVGRYGPLPFGGVVTDLGGSGPVPGAGYVPGSVHQAPAGDPDGALGNASAADHGTPRHGDALAVVLSTRMPLRLAPGAVAYADASDVRDRYRDIPVSPA